jgi:hypothetical protein
MIEISFLLTMYKIFFSTKQQIQLSTKENRRLDHTNGRIRPPKYTMSGLASKPGDSTMSQEEYSTNQ